MKRKATRIAVILVLLTAVPVVWRVLLRLDVNGRLAAVRDSGLPLNGEELNHWYAAVPDDQNAALVWASKTTAAVGAPIEVRPFWEMP